LSFGALGSFRGCPKPAARRSDAGGLQMKLNSLTHSYMFVRVPRCGSVCNNPNTGFTNKNFGQLTSTADPRTWQFGGKFYF
jgi:hypothetical protein